MAQNGGARHTRTAETSSRGVGVVVVNLERITLSQPRPDGMRNGNYYTETPLRPVRAPSKRTKTPDAADTRRCASVAPVHRTRISPAPPPIVPASDDKGSAVADSILCARCGKCKCMACRRPRELPSRWICDSRYECSAEALLDTCTCMCCVKGVLYHCSKDYDDDEDGRCVRWSCVGALSLVMPCLLCYWPLKACVRGCETCYARYHRRGCVCVTDRSCKVDSQMQSNKRLLDPHISL